MKATATEQSGLLSSAPAAHEEATGTGARRWLGLEAGSSRARACWAISLFMCFSTLMLPVNKLVMRQFVETPLTVVLVQMLSAALILAPFPGTFDFESWHDVKRWATTLPWLFAGMLATSMLALSYSSLGAYTVVRNAAPIITMPIEHLFQEKLEIDVPTVASLFTTLGGAILYVAFDISFSIVGMLFLLVNITLAVCERLTARRLTGVDPVRMSKSCMTFTSNLVGALPISVLLVACGELSEWHLLLGKSLSDYGLLALSCVLGVGSARTHEIPTRLDLRTNEPILLAVCTPAPCPAAVYSLPSRHVSRLSDVFLITCGSRVDVGRRTSVHLRHHPHAAHQPQQGGGRRLRNGLPARVALVDLGARREHRHHRRALVCVGAQRALSKAPAAAPGATYQGAAGAAQRG